MPLVDRPMSIVATGRTGPVHQGGGGRHFGRGQLLPADGSMPLGGVELPHHVQTDASVTIRPLMLALAQRVSQI